MQRAASCRCGRLSATCLGDPVRVSVCHCLDCQKRSGSAFAVQARFPAEAVTITGESQVYVHQNDSGTIARFRFCPSCGGTIAYTNDNAPGTIAIPLGAFDDPRFAGPRFSVWEERKHRWVEIVGEDIDRFA